MQTKPQTGTTERMLMTMKKTVWALAGLLALGALVAGCSGEKKEAAQSSDKKVVLKVGATPGSARGNPK